MNVSKGGIDPAALAVASLAAAISAIAPPGPYGPGSIMIGLTILAVIFGYDKSPARDWRETLAFSAACALISLLALGYPLEYVFTSDRAKRYGILFHEIHGDIDYSEVPPWCVISVWLAMTLLYVLLDRWRVRRSKRLTPATH